MGFVFLIIFIPIILPLLILGYTILFKSDDWTGEKRANQKFMETYYDEYVHSDNSPAYDSVDKLK